VYRGSARRDRRNAGGVANVNSGGESLIVGEHRAVVVFDVEAEQATQRSAK